jgi:hypothetical protein
MFKNFMNGSNHLTMVQEVKKMDHPIFIIGTERSGSNLLRVMLNAHSNITIPHPPHIMRFFHPLEKSYGDLKKKSNFIRLTDDILKLIKVHIHPWEIEIDRDKIYKEAIPRNVFGIFCAIYDHYARFSAKPRWGCKSTFMIEHTESIFEKYPHAQLIWLVRDPRDVAASSKNSVFNPFHPFLTATLWKKQQEIAGALEKKLSKKNILRVHYESLLTDTKGTVELICQFLGEILEKDMLEFYRSEASKKASRLSESWKNTARPILKNNAGKFLTLLNKKEIAWVESASSPVMETLNYPPIYKQPFIRQTSYKDRLSFHLSDSLMRLKTEYRSLRYDSNHMLRWRRDALISYLNLCMRLRSV